jgi:hypothetical protein
MVAAADEGLGECVADVACCANDEDVDHFEILKRGFNGVVGLGDVVISCSLLRGGNICQYWGVMIE